MRNLRALVVLPLLAPLALAYACGGDAKPPASPDTTAASATAAASAAASAGPVGSAATSAAVEAPKPVDTYAIPVVATKFTPDKAAKGWKPIEIKDDGSVVRMNKAYMKFAKGDLQDDTGKAFFTVTKDGAVAMGDKPYAKFDDKDALVITGGGTITIADDGAVKMLESDGKPSKTPTGKFDKVDPKGRRAAALLIATELWMNAPQPAAKDQKEPPKKK